MGTISDKYVQVKTTLRHCTPTGKSSRNASTRSSWPAESNRRPCVTTCIGNWQNPFGGEGGNWWVNQKSSILSGSVISFHIWKCMAVQRWKGFPLASPGPAPHASSLQSSFLRQQPPLHPHSISARISIPYKLLESTLSQSPQYSTHILGPQKIII